MKFYFHPSLCAMGNDEKISAANNDEKLLCVLMEVALRIICMYGYTCTHAHAHKSIVVGHFSEHSRHSFYNAGLGLCNSMKTINTRGTEK